MKFNWPLVASLGVGTATVAGVLFYLFSEEKKEKLNLEDSNKKTKSDSKDVEKSKKNSVLEYLDKFLVATQQDKENIKKISEKFAQNMGIKEVFDYTKSLDTGNKSDFNYSLLDNILKEYTNDAEVMQKVHKIMGTPDPSTLTQKSFKISCEVVMAAHQQINDDVKNFIEIYKTIKNEVTNDPMLVTVVCQAYIEYKTLEHFELSPIDLECGLLMHQFQLQTSESFRDLNFEIQLHMNELMQIAMSASTNA